MRDEDVIIWIGADDSILDFFKLNKPLQKLNKIHQIYFPYTGTECEKVLPEYFPNAILIPSKVNSCSVKGRDIFNVLKTNDTYKYAVRMCADGVIVNHNKLLELIYTRLKEQHAILGVVHNKTKSGQIYVRGGCNITYRSVIDQIDMSTALEFDGDYSESAIKVNAKFIHAETFTMGYHLNPKSNIPCWHVKRLEMKDRLKLYQRELQKL